MIRRNTREYAAVLPDSLPFRIRFRVCGLLRNLRRCLARPHLLPMRLAFFRRGVEPSRLLSVLLWFRVISHVSPFILDESDCDVLKQMFEIVVRRARPTSIHRNYTPLADWAYLVRIVGHTRISLIASMSMSGQLGKAMMCLLTYSVLGRVSVFCDCVASKGPSSSCSVTIES